MRKEIAVSEPWYNKQVDYFENEYSVHTYYNGDYIEVFQHDNGLVFNKADFLKFAEMVNAVVKDLGE